jgi:glutamate synthase domain-containing protein 2
VEYVDIEPFGVPLVEGIAFAHNTVRRADLRDQSKLGASGKAVTALDFVKASALGADWANSARGFMLSLWCSQP